MRDYKKSRLSKSAAPRVSEAEWTVLRVLWSGGPQTTSEIVEALKGSTDWKPQTVHTLLIRLAQKQAITVQRQGREHVYRPAVTAEDCEQALTQSFIDRFFDGQVAPFLARLVEREHLSRSEIEELKRILEKRKP